MLLEKEFEFKDQTEAYNFARSLQEQTGLSLKITKGGPSFDVNDYDYIAPFYNIWKDAQRQNVILIKRTWGDWLFDRRYDEMGRLIEEGPSVNRAFRLVFGGLAVVGVVIGVPLLVSLSLYVDKPQVIPYGFIGSIYGMIFGAATINEGIRRFTPNNHIKTNIQTTK